MSAFESHQGNKEQIPEKHQEEQLEKKPFKVFQGETVLVKRSDGSIENDWMVSETPFLEEEFIKVYKKDPENPENTLTKGILRSDMESMNGSEIDFNQAEDLDSLIKLVEKQGSLSGTSQEYSADILKEIIGKVESGEIEAKMITRAGGLRDAFEKIKSKENLNENFSKFQYKLGELYSSVNHSFESDYVEEALHSINLSTQEKYELEKYINTTLGGESHMVDLSNFLKSAETEYKEKFVIKKQFDSRAGKINEYLEENISNEVLLNRAKIEAHNINEIIKNIPSDEQGKYTGELLQLVTSKELDLQGYLDLSKKIESRNISNKEDKQKEFLEPDYNKNITLQELWINGQPRTIQTQEDGSDVIKINKGRGWELISRDKYREFLDTVDKEDTQERALEIEQVEEKEDIKLTKEEVLKELHYTANMSPDEWRGYMSNSVSGRKRILENITLIQKEDNNKTQEDIEEFISEIENNSFIEPAQNQEALEYTDEKVGVQEVFEQEISKEKLPTEILDIHKQYLAYQDVNPEGSIDYALNEEGVLQEGKYRNYTESLSDILDSERAESLETVKGTIRNYYEHIKQNLGLEDTIFGKSDSWIYWDIAKQEYMVNNPESSTQEYLLADPLDFENSTESRELIQQIADRHIAWEICNPQNINSFNEKGLSQRAISLIEKAKENPGSQALSSSEYSELGRLIREANSQENIFN